jgi:hypothetical protein
MPQISDQATVLLLVDSLVDIPSNFQVYEPASVDIKLVNFVNTTMASK